MFSKKVGFLLGLFGAYMLIICIFSLLYSIFALRILPYVSWFVCRIFIFVLFFIRMGTPHLKFVPEFQMILPSHSLLQILFVEGEEWVSCSSIMFEFGFCKYWKIFLHLVLSLMPLTLQVRILRASRSRKENYIYN